MYKVKLKSFEDRAGGITDRIKRAIKDKDPMALVVNPYEQNSVLGMIYKQTASIKDAQILAFGPPMIPGFSVQNGVTIIKKTMPVRTAKSTLLLRL